MIRLSLIAFALTFLPLGFGEDRSIDGTGNNLSNPQMGSAHQPFDRMAPVMYGDGMQTMGGSTRPNPREISNVLCAQTESIVNASGLSDMVWLWGQFVDHDITLAETGTEAAMIPVPAGDPSMDPMGTGAVMIPFTRSDFMAGTGTSASNPRLQMNSNTAFIDASMVYGSDMVTAMALRLQANGDMRMSSTGLLMKNTFGLTMDNPLGLPQSELFAAGDIRVNEHAGLTALHTLFSREHNRLTIQLRQQHPSWGDEQLYQRARKLVGAMIQSITYNEWLPALLGPAAPGPGSGYDPTLMPGIDNEFSAALYRVGHTMINAELPRVQNNNLPAPGGAFALATAFFNPSLIPDGTELDFYLKGLCAHEMQMVDNRVIEDVRDFLFGPPGAGGFDLAALNIQRGRDHGLADYNMLRQGYGLTAVQSFADITADADTASRLEMLYGNVNDIDPWIGALAEDHLPGAAVGELIAAALTKQFVRLRDGDRFFYRWDTDLSPADVADLEATTLRDLIVRNTGVGRLQDNVFQVIPPTRIQITQLNLPNFQMQMAWSSDANASYQLEVSQGIDNSAWVPIGIPVSGNGSTNVFTSGVGAPPLRFWRLRQYP